MTLKSLETRLRHLPKLEVPEELENRLLAAIPDSKPKVTQEHQVKWYSRASDFGATAAAAVLILALMLIVDYGLSIPSQMSLTTLRDTSLCYIPLDQNNCLYDLNSTCVDENLPGDLQLNMINQNETVLKRNRGHI